MLLAERDGRRGAVLLLFYGGPGSLEDIPQFLAGLRGHPPTSELVERTTARYRAIGGASPAHRITVSTARRLSDAVDLPVFVAALHWRPSIEEVIPTMAAAGVHEALAICMAPHYSEMSVGSYRRRVEDAAALCAPLRVVVTQNWHRESGYIVGLAEGVQSALARFDPDEQERAVVLFTAHSLPRAGLPRDDPYQAQLEETAEAVSATLGLPRERWRLAYQSTSGPSSEWLGPTVEQQLEEIAAAGATNVVVCPAGFIAEQVEILYDIDVALAARARELSLHLERTPLLNDGARLVEALAALVSRWKEEN